MHGLGRLVLIAHQGCAFYGETLKVPAADLERRQLEDIVKAAERIRLAQRSLAIEAYLARRHDAQVWFEPVPIA